MLGPFSRRCSASARTCGRSSVHSCGMGSDAVWASVGPCIAVVPSRILARGACGLCAPTRSMGARKVSNWRSFPLALRLGGTQIPDRPGPRPDTMPGERCITIGAGTAPPVRRAREGRDEENGLTQEITFAANRSTPRHSEPQAKILFRIFSRRCVASDGPPSILTGCSGNSVAFG